MYHWDRRQKQGKREGISPFFLIVEQHIKGVSLLTGTVCSHLVAIQCHLWHLPKPHRVKETHTKKKKKTLTSSLIEQKCGLSLVSVLTCTLWSRKEGTVTPPTHVLCHSSSSSSSFLLWPYIFAITNWLYSFWLTWSFFPLFYNIYSVLHLLVQTLSWKYIVLDWNIQPPGCLMLHQMEMYMYLFPYISAWAVWHIWKFCPSNMMR